MGDLVIRRAEPKDIKAMAALDTVCFAAPWSEESFRQEIENNNLALYLVGEVDGILAGYAGIWAIVDEGHITNVAVHPDFRRCGVAKAMMEVLIQSCAEEGIFRQTLEVRPSNEAALALYEGFGFRIEGRRKGYYEDNGEDALIMWRSGAGSGPA